MEIWKDIKGYEGSYQISSKGGVKSLGRINSVGAKIKEKEMSPSTNSKGYKQITLYKDSKGKGFKVHRLVGEAFIENKNEYLQINHKDKATGNNNIDNLEWCDGFYNMDYSKAKDFNIESPAGIRYKVHNLRKFCRDNNLEVRNLHKVISKERNTHKGWKTYDI